MEEKEIEIPIYKLTQAGKDILGVIGEKYDENYFQDLTNYLARKNQEITFTIHDIVNKDNETIQYVTEGKIVAH